MKRVLSVNYDLAVVSYLRMPEDQLGERSKENGIDYGVWVRAVHLQTTPGSVEEYVFIFRSIVDEIELVAAGCPRRSAGMSPRRWRLKQFGYDPWNAMQFALQLEKAEFEPVAVRQKRRKLYGPRARCSTPSRTRGASTTTGTKR